MKNLVKISVRKLVEHVFLSGNIESGFFSINALQEGTRIHQEVQKTFDETSEKEVYVQTEFFHDDLHFIVDGRCDGIHFNNGEITIEEIKSTSEPLDTIEENGILVHWAQAYFYGYIYCNDHQLKDINIQLTYVQKKTNEKKSILQKKTIQQLKEFVLECIEKYTPFAKLMIQNKERRNKSSKELTFPFKKYRNGQKELAGMVYRSIRDKQTLFAEAPTGIGKTISTTFPAVKAFGEEILDRILYITARNTTREAALNAFSLLENNGLKMIIISLTAKEKICFKDEVNCSALHCEFANGHYDRLNDGILDILQNETIISREVIEHYARKHRLCPFEFSIDLAYLADAIVCDYNYVFDPTVSFKRFFEEQKKETVLLIDEAHNLVDRAREMYSASILKSSFLQLKRDFKKNKEIQSAAKNLNNYLLEIRKHLGDKKQTVSKEIPSELLELIQSFVEVVERNLHHFEGQTQQQLLDAYFAAQAFLRSANMFDERFVFMTEVDRSEVSVKLFCIDPSHLLQQYSKNFKAKVFFSATLSPLPFYKDMLGGKEEDLVISLPSPFSSEQVNVYISPLSTKYREREYTKEKIAYTLHEVIQKHPGNYLIFFPSYQYMNLVYDEYSKLMINTSFKTQIQTPNMNEEEREEFLNQFDKDRSEPLVGFAVMGGIFSEGIDLVGDRLNGVAIVGVGIPQIGFERDLIKNYFSSIGKNGYDYAYVYPGMNKVLQAGGRLIRSENDTGTILLIDDRFLTTKYLKMLPKNWKKFQVFQ